jgi:hypothetical protein
MNMKKLLAALAAALFWAVPAKADVVIEMGIGVYMPLRPSVAAPAAAESAVKPAAMRQPQNIKPAAAAAVVAVSGAAAHADLKVPDQAAVSVPQVKRDGTALAPAAQMAAKKAPAAPVAAAQKP